MNPIPYPLRINRYLALKGVVTRRDADILIAQGKIKINGHTAKLGDIIKENDRVTVEQKPNKKYSYVAYYKPRNVITHSPQPGERDIQGMLKTKSLFPIGRLDKDSEGLVILTNDGRVTDRLLNPKYEHEKEYEVETDRPLKPNFKERMEGGVVIEGYKTKPAIVGTLGPKRFRIVLTEGKKHQIRRMSAALGYQVKNLKRLRIMNIKLQELKQNESRIIQKEELEEFLRNLGLS
jgi:23S rRNA pseudouridine2604 synthase